MWQISNEGFVRTLTIDRPEAMNALSPAIIDELIEQLERADVDDSVRVLIMTGAGKVFTSGMDLQALANRHEPEYMRMFGESVPKMFDTFTDFSKPLIMAVNGVGTGFGATVLGLADIVIMAESARLKAPFAALANVPEACSTNTFPRKLGHGRALWFLLSGEWMDAQQCKELGLAMEVVADEALIDEVMRRAQVLASYPLSSLVHTKSLMMAPYREQMKQANHAELALFTELLDHPASQEGVAAIKEKRAPDFSRF